MANIMQILGPHTFGLAWLLECQKLKVQRHPTGTIGIHFRSYLGCDTQGVSPRQFLGSAHLRFGRYRKSPKFQFFAPPSGAQCHPFLLMLTSVEITRRYWFDTSFTF